MLLLSAMVAVLLLVVRSLETLRMVRRARWLLISLMVIYAVATPGDPVFSALGSISPTFQGIRGGTLQSWRLILLLLTLGILLCSCTRQDMLSGIYVLLRPLVFIGFRADRLAVRLWLTLQYAEAQPRRKIQEWWGELHSTLDSGREEATEITLDLPLFTWCDLIVLALATLLLGLLLW